VAGSLPDGDRRGAGPGVVRPLPGPGAGGERPRRGGHGAPEPLPLPGDLVRFPTPGR